MPRYAARADGNQPEIAEAFRRFGCTVAYTHTVGEGFPDLVVGRAGKNLLVEIKDPTKPKRDQQLTGAQKEFHAGWNGVIEVVKTVDDVRRACIAWL